MPLKNNILLLVALLACFTLVACSSSPHQANTSTSKKNMDPNKGRYALKNDKLPLNPPNVDHVQNATPKYEPYSRRGNKPYTV
ncbi:MAG: septal ring lytic transglycosylase RlpA family protein, partial [Shewanella sp.]